MLEARLSVLVTGVQVIQPVNLMGPSYDLLSSKSSMPSAEAYQIVLTVPEIQVLLRMHDYYMGMYTFRYVTCPHLIIFKTCL